MSILRAPTIGTSLAIAALGFVQPSVLRADVPEPFPIAGMPPLAPDTRRETLQATDGSWHDCMVFTTVPGVLYTIQRSSDLNTWTDETSHYGLGHDFATALRAVDGPAAPAPPGGEPPPIPVPSLRLVSVTLRPSAGVDGGTVVSWPSLHGASPAAALIPEEIDAAWGVMPLYARDFDGWMFFIRHCPLPAAPPAADDPPPAGLDADMLASFQQHLPTMTAEVQASVERARNSPPPTPPDPDGRRFWRVRAGWSADTDTDGTPDWIEWRGMLWQVANPGAIPPGAAFYDVMNADTNGDGRPDGFTTDSDGDGEANASDANAANPVFSQSIFAALPRHAVFPILNAAPAAWESTPLQISDRGTVLFTNGTWTAGAWTPLAAVGASVLSAQARAINSHDQVLGFGLTITLPGASGPTEHGLCHWPSPSAAPIKIEGDDIGGPVYPVPGEALAANQLAPAPVFSDDGSFFAATAKYNGDFLEGIRWSQWTLPSGSGDAGEQPAGSFLFIRSPGIFWGPDEWDWTQGLVAIPQALPLEWSVTGTRLLDTTPRGWVLASCAASAATPAYAVLLPVRAEGVDPDYEPPPPDPVTGESPPPPPFHAGGVDRISMTALGGSGYVRKIRIMAPNGGAANTVRILAPLNSRSTLRLMSDDKVSFPAAPLSDEDQQIEVRGLGEETDDILPTLQLGEAVNSVNKPVGVYAMKKRAFKLAVHNVIGRDAGGSPVESMMAPDDAGWIGEELDKIYGRQANLFFEVTIHREAGPEGAGIDFDTAGPTPRDGKLLYLPGDPEFEAATPNPRAAGDNPTANMDVWVVPARLVRPSGGGALGRRFIRGGSQGAIINGNLLDGIAGSNAEDLFIHVLAHEIGHAMIGSGHPDTGGSPATLCWNQPPPSRLKPSADPRDRQRLMFSQPVFGAGHSVINGKQLIYREWQLIEAWLKQHVDTPAIPLPPNP